MVWQLTFDYYLSQIVLVICCSDVPRELLGNNLAIHFPVAINTTMCNFYAFFDIDHTIQTEITCVIYIHIHIYIYVYIFILPLGTS